MNVSSDQFHLMPLQYASLMGQIRAVSLCGGSEPGAALQALGSKAEESRSALCRVASLESTVQSQMEELASMRSAIKQRDRDVEKSQSLLKTAEEQLEAWRTDAGLLEASVVEAKRALQVVGQHCMKCMVGRNVCVVAIPTMHVQAVKQLL